MELHRASSQEGGPRGIRELMSGGVSEEEILGAFTACIEMAPERVTFFPRDFLKWRKVLRAHRKSEQREAQMREERQVREGDRAREQRAAFAGARTRSGRKR